MDRGDHPAGAAGERTEPKRHFDGTHRRVEPHETVARIRPLMAKMGITRVANVTGLDRIGIPVVTVCRPNSRSLSVSQGKGRDLDAAVASGLMEASELFHAEHMVRPLKLGSMAELSPSHPFADVGRLAQVAGSRFHPHLVTLWTEGRDLFSGEPRWVPYESVHTNFTLPAAPGSGCFDCSSNGLASGNGALEATCHALCEVIERDATALWNGLPPAERVLTRIDPATVGDGACRSVMERLETAGFDLAIWETTTDIGVPCFFCLIEDERDPTSHHGIGAGCHPAPGIALLRALTEAVQVRTTYISGARDDLLPEDYGEQQRSARRAAARRLRSGGAGMRDFSAIADHSRETFAEDLDWLLSRLRAAGMGEAIAVDLSRPELGIPVVRVIVPGLEGPDDHPGYVAGDRARRLGAAR